MGSIPAGNIHKGTRRAKTGRQTYVSLITHMSVFPFLYGDANDRGREAFEVQRLVLNYRAPARDEEGRRPSRWHDCYGNGFYISFNIRIMGVVSYDVASIYLGASGIKIGEICGLVL